MSEDGEEYEAFTIISIDSLLAYDNKYYLQVYLEIFFHKIGNLQMADYLSDNLFESDKIVFDLIALI